MKEGCILLLRQVIVMPGESITGVHTSRSGTVRMKSLTYTQICQPREDKMIEEVVKTCSEFLNI